MQIFFDFCFERHRILPKFSSLIRSRGMLTSDSFYSFLISNIILALTRSVVILLHHRLPPHLCPTMHKRSAISASSSLTVQTRRAEIIDLTLSDEDESIVWDDQRSDSGNGLATNVTYNDVQPLQSPHSHHSAHDLPSGSRLATNQFKAASKSSPSSHVRRRLLQADFSFDNVIELIMRSPPTFASSPLIPSPAPDRWRDEEIWGYIQNSAYSLERLESRDANGRYVKVHFKDGTCVDISNGYAAVLISIGKLVWIMIRDISMPASLQAILLSNLARKRWNSYKFGLLHLCQLTTYLLEARIHYMGARELHWNEHWHCPEFDETIAWAIKYGLAWEVTERGLVGQPADVLKLWRDDYKDAKDILAACKPFVNSAQLRR
jgi:hypothetical protein